MLEADTSQAYKSNSVVDSVSDIDPDAAAERDRVHETVDEEPAPRKDGIRGDDAGAPAELLPHDPNM